MAKKEDKSAKKQSIKIEDKIIDETTKKLPEQLSAKKEEFSEWMSQILQLAGIIDNRYDIKSMYVWMPYGYDIMLRIKSFWDEEFKKNGIKEMYFPLMVPIQYAEQNASWWAGFKNEGWWAGTKDKQEFIIRPTGEPAMYPMFALWTRGISDLPIRIYETVFSYRYETKQTRPLIRDREIGPWYEIHTAHATRQEAEQEIELAKEMNNKIWQKLAVKPILVRKPKWECFPGAEGALEYYTLMPNGKVIENGSLNNLGQAYAKEFNIKFIDRDGQEKFAWQTCTGNGERFLAAAIAEHGDDSGLVLPPSIAPIQVQIIPIYNEKNKEGVMKKAHEIISKLQNIRAEIDSREISPGKKFYDSELRGIPLRIELGEKEIKENQLTLFIRHQKKKIKIEDKNLVQEIQATLENIQKELLEKSIKRMTNSIKHTSKKEEVLSIVNSGKLAKFYWCGEGDCYDKIKELGEGLDIIGSDIVKHEEEKCIICGEKTATMAFAGNSY